MNTTWICNGLTANGEEFCAHEPIENHDETCDFCGLDRSEVKNEASSEQTFDEGDADQLTQVISHHSAPKWWLPGLGVILLFLGIGFASTSFLGHSDNPGEKVNPELKNSPSILPSSPSPTFSPAKPQIYPSASQPVNPTSQLKHFTYAKISNQINLDYPQHWERQENSNLSNGQQFKLLSPRNQKNEPEATLTFSLIDLSYHPRSLSLESYSEIHHQDMIQRTSRTVPNPVETTLSFRKAMTMSYQTEMDGNLVEVQEIWTLDNNKAYILTSIVDLNSSEVETLKKDLENIISSFRVIF